MRITKAQREAIDAATKKKPRAPKGQGSVYQSGGRWRGEVTINGVVHRPSAATRELAQAKVEALLAGKDPGKAVPKPRTVGAWLLEWLAREEAKAGDGEAKKWGTVHGYRRLAENHTIPRIGNIRLDELRTPDVVEMLDDMARVKYAASTRRNARNVLSAALGDARSRGLIVENVARGIKLPQAGSGFVIEGADERTAARILDAVIKSPFRDFYCFLLYLCARTGEIQALRWENVHLKKQEVTIKAGMSRMPVLDGSGRMTRLVESTTKTRRTRIVPIPAEMRDLVSRRYREAGGPETGLVFPSKTNPDRPLDARWLYEEFQKRLADAGFHDAKRWRLHDLRHLGISLLLANGADIAVVSKIAGHADPSITARLYSHPLTGRDRAAADTLRFFTTRKPPTDEDGR